MKLVIKEGTVVIKETQYENKGITELILPDSVEIIEDFTFYDNDIRELTLPNSVDKIGEGAFYNNKNLKLVKLSKELFDKIKDDEYIFDNINKIKFIDKETNKLLSTKEQKQIERIKKEIQQQAIINVKLKKVLEVELYTTRRITTRPLSRDKQSFFIENKDDFETMKKWLNSKEYTYNGAKIHCVDESKGQKGELKYSIIYEENQSKLAYKFDDLDSTIGSTDKKTKEKQIEVLWKELNSDKLDYEKLSIALWKVIEKGQVKKTKRIFEILEKSLEEQKKEFNKNLKKNKGISK